MAKQQTKKRVNKLTIDDFVAVIPWEQVRGAFCRAYGKRDGNKKFKELSKFMIGQTCIDGGIYPDDLDRFLRGLPVVD